MESLQGTLFGLGPEVAEEHLGPRSDFVWILDLER